ncbi:MAG: arylsulfatase [Acidimicrobiia bacterium]|nr:arylsulfatase [Acidimicrobiia bacterium]
MSSIPSDHPNRPYEGFEGDVGRVVGTSTPAWPPYPQAPDGAPNVVVMLADDLGFADLGCYGSEIDTPRLDQVARDGLQFTNFHVNPMCSPTRASLLTGLNSHLAGIGHVCHADPGFPGYAMEITDRAATMAEILRDNGWATLMVGKWHLTKDAHLSDAAPKHSWPCQKGFDRFYGILDGFTNFHQPHRLYADNHHVDVDEYPDGYYFTDDICDQALSMIRDVKAYDPAKPFFLYFSHGAVHAPLQAKPADMDKYRGAYDAGWDELRARRFARQIELGIIDADTPLPPRNHEDGNEVVAWDDLDDRRRELFARYMEIYAGMVDSIDQSVGRLLDELDALGQLDNTIFVFTSDNGGSREGEAEGSSSYFDVLSLAAGITTEYDNVDFDYGRLDLMGGPQTLPHYPRGWAMVSNTPYRLYKINTHAGGHQVPFLIQWPGGPVPAGSRRSQYQHVTDLLPTVLDLAGVDPPTQRHGAPTLPAAGATFTSVLSSPDADSTHAEQYYEMVGHRGYYRDGWEAVTLHAARTPFGDHEWQLYDLTTDPTETTDLASRHPDRVADLAARFEAAAWANQVFPIDEGTGLKMIQRPPTELALEAPVTIRPGTPTLERYRSLQLINSRSCTITVGLGGYRSGDRGYLVAHGDQGGGYGFYIDDGELVYVHNGYGKMGEVRGGAIPDGCTEIVVELVSRSRTELEVVLSADGHQVGSGGPFAAFYAMAPFQGIDVGRNRRSPVSWPVFERERSFPYTGEIVDVTYTPGELAADAGRLWLDFLREQGAKFE